jgi:hypothetical protein
MFRPQNSSSSCRSNPTERMNFKQKLAVRTHLTHWMRRCWQSPLPSSTWAACRCHCHWLGWRLVWLQTSRCVVLRLQILRGRGETPIAPPSLPPERRLSSHQSRSPGRRSHGAGGRPCRGFPIERNEWEHILVGRIEWRLSVIWAPRCGPQFVNDLLVFLMFSAKNYMEK